MQEENHVPKVDQTRVGTRGGPSARLKENGSYRANKAGGRE